MFSSIGIIGLGLIGGSLSKKIKEVFPSVSLYGLDLLEENLSDAAVSKLFECVCDDLSFWPKQMDLVIVATPMDEIVTVVTEVSSYIDSQCLITDVASVKTAIVSGVASFSLKEGHSFIGGHPIFGSEFTGFKASSASLATGAPYVLTPSSSPFYSEFISFLSQLDFSVMELSSEVHDMELARVSHLPFLLSHLLMQVALKSGANLSLAGPGFKGNTRLSQSDPQWAEGICRLNKDAVLSVLREFRSVFDRLEMLVKADQKEMLLAQFKQVQSAKKALN